MLLKQFIKLLGNSGEYLRDSFIVSFAYKLSIWFKS